MGQAKQRGSFEQRRMQAIQRDEAQRIEIKLKEEEYLASLTDEQKQSIRNNRQRVTNLMLMLAGITTSTTMKDHRKL